MHKAPLYHIAAEAPAGGKARWVTTSDGVRLRFGWWGAGQKGTILFFPGRTEYIEKYGRTVADFATRGYASVVIDWRGQGLSDRLVPNRQLGHVVNFTDYQLDVAAVLDALGPLNLPRPYYLCAHSMGGAIGLRALSGGQPVTRAVFSAPMWGMMIDPMLRPLVQAVMSGTKSLGLGEEFAPGTGGRSYIESHGYADNPLTSDPEVFAHMARMIELHPGLSIGGPSVHWIYESLIECRTLMKSPPPAIPALSYLGSDETVIDKRDVATYMDAWPGGELEIIKNARHEIMMETPEIRQAFLDGADRFFSRG